MSKNSPQHTYLEVIDHSVSGEKFQLILNSDFGFLETYPQPHRSKIKKYYESEDYISHTDSRRNIIEKVYHLIKKFSLTQKLKLINRYKSQDQKLLDIGCGTGDFLRVAQRDGWEIFGTEPNKHARNLANSKTDNAVLKPEALFEFERNEFDVITMWHVFEHVLDLEKHIEAFKTILKPNGALIIAVPNYKSYDAKYYREFWAAYDVPRHLWHFNRNSITKLFDNFGLQVVNTNPMWFDSFYVSLLSEKYKSGKMNFFRSFYIGMLSNLKAFFTKEASSIIYVIKKQ